MTSEGIDDLCVVGSGFGGGIAALRGSERGWSVRILERGRPFAPGSFPRDIADVDDVFWRYPRRASRRGLFDLQPMQDIGVVTAAGIGGGSLIYANVLVRPDAWVFEDARWPDAYRLDTLRPWFERVEGMLSPSPLPVALDLPKRNLFRYAAQRMGRPVFDPPQAVSWEDPQTSGRAACTHCAECEFGCNRGAKNTVDLTYVHGACRAGAVLQSQRRVDWVSKAPHGFTLHGVTVSDGRPFTAKARRVVLAAGTLGTNAILLRSRNVARTLPDLSETIGRGFSANGDFLGHVFQAARSLEPWHGTDVTSVIRFTDRQPRFTMAAPSFSEPVMDFLSRSPVPTVGDRASRCLQPVWRRSGSILDLAARTGAFRRPRWSIRRDPAPSARMTNLFCIGQDNANGRLRLRDDRIDCVWDYGRENAALIQAQQQAMQEVASIYGGQYKPSLPYALFRRILTVHPLGGARIGRSPVDGVVDERGEVFGYPGLYIADGSLIPTAIGFHPALTIAAIAERVSATLE